MDGEVELLGHVRGDVVPGVLLHLLPGHFLAGLVGQFGEDMTQGRLALGHAGGGLGQLPHKHCNGAAPFGQGLDGLGVGVDPGASDSFGVGCLLGPALGGPVQDAADLSLTEYCLAHGVPTLAVCRGLHVVNVVRGGTLIVDMPVNHRHVVQDVHLDQGSAPLGIDAADVTISCYHHQAIDRLGEGLQVVARAADGTVEAVVIDSPGWAVGVQWHPEDTWASDPLQVELLGRFVAEAGRTGT